MTRGEKTPEEVMDGFRTTWRELGWWAEVEPRNYGQFDDYNAALWPPHALEQMLDADDEKAKEIWRHASHYDRSKTPPERRDMPALATVNTDTEGRWFSALTLAEACLGAISLAADRYPDGMPISVERLAELGLPKIEPSE